ncbi:UDP-glucose dehydrogenase [Neocallimastix sp. 'constans']
MICNQENNSKTNCILNQSKYLYCENIIKSSNDVPLERPINVCYIGAGYVGGTSGAVMAYKCPEDRVKVTICDTCETKINSWNSDKLLIYEPGLDEVIKNSKGKNLFFTTDIENSIHDVDTIFISVGTPTKIHGFGSGQAAELGFVESATRAIAKFSKSSKIVVEKSTVPVPCRTAEHIQTILNSNKNKISNKFDDNEGYVTLSRKSSNSTIIELLNNPNNDTTKNINNDFIHFEILSNPEFLAEGTAVNDILNPDRVLIGGKDTEEGIKAQNLLKRIYSYWIPDDKIILMNLWSAELSKLAANALLAQRISSINALSLLCEKVGADIKEVSYACGLDTRIGPKFMNASVGFGGSCFKKDVLNLVYLCNSFNLSEAAEYWNQVVKMNEHRKEMFIKRIFKKLYHTLFEKKICVLGFAFKKDTKDTRESPSITVVMSLLKEGATVSIKNNIKIYDNAYDATNNSDAIVICTEWDEFKMLDYEKIYYNMNRPSYIFDGRIILDHQNLKRIGFNVETIGKKLSY